MLIYDLFSIVAMAEVGLAAVVVRLAALWTRLASLDVTSTGWIVASVSGWTDLALVDGSGEVNKKLEDDRRDRGRIPHLCPLSKELFSVPCGSVMFIWVCVEIKARLDTPFPKIPLQHTKSKGSFDFLRKAFTTFPLIGWISQKLSKKLPRNCPSQTV